MNLKEFTQKERQLEEIKKRLKAQFFGLDHVIDQLIDSLRTWYYIPQFQTRPLVINLWGSASVGKSQLVESIMSELGIGDSFLSINAKDLHRSGLFEDISRLQITEKPVRAVFCIDNFQKVLRAERRMHPWVNLETEPIWEILDEGIIRATKPISHAPDILDSIGRGLSFMIDKGLKIENGFVKNEFVKDFSANKKVWEYSGRTIKKNWDQMIGSDIEGVFVFNYHEVKILFDFEPKGFEKIEDLVCHLKTLNQDEILAFVNSIIKKSLHSEELDLSQCVVFVIGNLEEMAIPENENQREGKSYTEVISVEQVREILWQHMPIELISKLGNNHLIFPKPGVQEFRKVIQQELESIQTKFQEETESIIEFDSTVIDWILSEGAVPGLGIRPIFSTIQSAIIDNLPSIMLGLSGFKTKADRVSITMDRGLDVKYWKGEKSILQSWHPVPSRKKNPGLSEESDQNSN